VSQNTQKILSKYGFGERKKYPERASKKRAFNEIHSKSKEKSLKRGTKKVKKDEQTDELVTIKANVQKEVTIAAKVTKGLSNNTKDMVSKLLRKKGPITEVPLSEINSENSS